MSDLAAAQTEKGSCLAELERKIDVWYSQ
jgi:hypothetical protein